MDFKGDKESTAKAICLSANHGRFKAQKIKNKARFPPAPLFAPNIKVLKAPAATSNMYRTTTPLACCL